MQSTRIPAAQQRGLMQIHPAVGMGILAVGLGLLVFAMARGMTRPVAAAPGTEEALAKAEADANRLDSQVKSMSEEATKGEATLKGKQEDFAQRTKRLESREEEIKRLEFERDRRVAETRKKVDEDQSQIRKEVADANQALMQKDNERQEQANVQRFLADYEKMLVTVVNSDLGLNTGFFLEVQQKMYVATHKLAAPANTVVLIRLRIRLPGDQTPYTALLRGVVAYKDAQTGLAFLGLDTSNLNLRFTITGFKTSALAECATGEKVYSLGSQVLGTQFLEFSAVDGNVSAEEREVGRGRYMQVAMAANPGSTGSPIFNVKGQIVGILVGPAPDLEKTAFAISSRQVLDAIDRWQNGGVAAANPNVGTSNVAQPNANKGNPVQGNAPLQANQPVRRFSPQEALTAAQNRAAPYKDADAIKGFPSANGRDAAQVSNGVMIRDTNAQKVFNYMPAAKKKAWEFDLKNYGYQVVLEGSGKRILVISNNENQPSVELDPSSGGVLGTYASASKLYNLNAYYNLGSCWLVTGPDSFYLANPATGEHFGPNISNLNVIGIYRNQILAVTGQGNLAIADSSRLQSLLFKIQDCNRQISQQSNAKAGPQALAPIYEKIRELNEQVKTQFQQTDLSKVLPTGVRFGREVIKHVPGTFKVFIYGQLFEMNSEGAKLVGSLQTVEHSSAQEAWFEHYWFGYTWSSRPWVADVSPDGRYAVTQSHVYDIASLQAVAEIPTPDSVVGFSGDGKMVYAYDKVRSKLAFYSLEELIAKGVKH